MTEGQGRANLELKRIVAASAGDIEILSSSEMESGSLAINFSLRIGPIETRPGGLRLREREEFFLLIPVEYPFDRPNLVVLHDRFASFPHVIWKRTICLYQAEIEWNPTDGLYGFFDRLVKWLTQAAINDMDPLEGPLEPPHHYTSSDNPYVILANAPVPPGVAWVGFAVVKRFEHRTELIDWCGLSESLNDNGSPVLAIFLAHPLPMEFPKQGADLFNEFEKAGVNRATLMLDLTMAAILTPEDEALNLVVGLPMRRAADGTPRVHIAVWRAPPETAALLRLTVPQDTDTQNLAEVRDDVKTGLGKILDKSDISWCKVFDDRPEIVVRRDANSAMSWFGEKSILILGCGALGSWIGESIARANASTVDVVDKTLVKPGLLARQNYRRRSIGQSKASALADRLRGVRASLKSGDFQEDAYSFIFNDLARFRGYDLVIDCTASALFQMKLERDWGKLGNESPPIFSVVIDAGAQYGLSVIVPQRFGGGVWDAYMALKTKVTSGAQYHDVAYAFYSDRLTQRLVQPEPGCSDPTFFGSMSDVVPIALNALNAAATALSNVGKNQTTALGAVIVPHYGDEATRSAINMPLDSAQTLQCGGFRVRISSRIITLATSWVKQNNRLRGAQFETGGLLWGLWDNATMTIWINDLSGPPPDSQHQPAHFLCGVEGTKEDHERRIKRSFGSSGFVGHWHTHPGAQPVSSIVDISGMTNLVSHLGQNQIQSIMLIFGRVEGKPYGGLYAYQSQSADGKRDFITVGQAIFPLKESVV